MQDQNRELIDIAHEAEIILHMYPEVAGLLRRAVFWLETVRNVNPEIIHPGPTPEEMRRDLLEAQNGVAILTQKITVWPYRIERLAVAVDETLPGIGRTLRHVRRVLNPAWHDIQGFDWEPALAELRMIREEATRTAAVADESGDAADGDGQPQDAAPILEGNAGAGDGQDTGNRVKKKGRGRNINGAMLDTLQGGAEDARGWTAREWATELKCSVSTIHGTATWKELSAARKLAQADRAMSKHRRSKGTRKTEQD